MSLITHYYDAIVVTARFVSGLINEKNSTKCNAIKKKAKREGSQHK